jgi:hypothetical protein
MHSVIQMDDVGLQSVEPVVTAEFERRGGGIIRDRHRR